MNDHYSEVPQPPLQLRIENAMNGVPAYLKLSISPRKLNAIVRGVVVSAPKYSLSGYRMFGLSEDINKIIDGIEQAKVSRCSCCPF
jgi:hypothetical protein